MHTKTVDAYTIKYSTNVATTTGITVKQSAFAAAYYAIHHNGPERIICPEEPINIEVTGTIQVPAGKPPIKIGFVQSIITSNRVASYTVNHEFRRYFDRLPVKDGPGYVWYREDADELFSHRGPAQEFPFTIKTHDLPKFCFPDPISKHAMFPNDVFEAESASVKDEFITCIMAQYANRNYFLHEFRWNFTAEWRLGLPAAGSYGIELTHDAPLERLSAPRGIKLDGDPANEAERMSFR